MQDLDHVLERLGRQPVDARLETIDAGIFSRVDVLRERRALRRTVGSLAIVALGIGITGGTFPEERAAAEALSVLSSPPPLAPSKLLNAGYDR